MPVISRLTYPTGESKPILRGVFHIISALTFPQTVLIASLFVKKNYNEFLKFFIIGESQFIASSILHISSLNYKWIQTFDHILIFLSLCGITNFLRFYNHSTKAFIPNIIITILGILNKLFTNSRKANMSFLLLSGLTSVIPLFKAKMPFIQRIIFYNIVFNHIAEFVCYITKWPLTNNKVFTYHEAIHVLSVINAYLLLLFISRA